MRAAKIAGAALLGLCLLSAILGSALILGREPLLRWTIEGPLSRATGQQIRIEGPLSIGWGLPTRVVAENVHVANAAWGSRPDMFVAQRLELDITPSALFGGLHHLARVDIDHALVLLETSRGGQSNWDFLRDRRATGAERAFPTFDRLVLHDATFIYRDGATGAERDLIARRLELDASDPGGPMRLAAEGSFQHLPARLAGMIGSPRPYRLDLQASLGGARLLIEGTASQPLELSGIAAHFHLSGSVTRDLAAALGLPLPPFPDVSAAGDLSGGDGAWSLTAFTLRLGHSDVAGSLTLQTSRGHAPHLRAKVASGSIDTADLAALLSAAAPIAATPPPSSAHPILPAIPLPTAALAGLDADLDLDLNRLAGALPLQRLHAALHLARGVLGLRPARAAVAGGEAALDLLYDSRAKPPALTLNIDLRRLDLERLAGAPALAALLAGAQGIAGGFAHIHSAGATLRELLERMNGDAALFAENGELTPALATIIDPGVLRALDLAAADRPVTVACLAARFDIRNGIATAATLLADTSRAVLVGKGGFNFAAETIFLDLTPYHKLLTPDIWRSPVAVRGTFAAPSVTVSQAGTLERLGAALTPDMLAPPSALQPLIEAGLGTGNACAAGARIPPPSGPPQVGSSMPPR